MIDLSSKFHEIMRNAIDFADVVGDTKRAAI